MKQRFSSLDVKVIAQELSQALCTLRLSNVYDLSSRIFLLKFAKPDRREALIIDSGFRCHLTSFTRATATAPSAFVSRLRKFLRSRRITSVAQVGTDRIVELQFSDGQYRLFLEFYAGGNILLTDKDLSILSLLRNVPQGPDQEELRIGLKYSLENRQNYHGVPPLTKERVVAGLKASLERAVGDAAKTQKRSKKKACDVLRKALATSLPEFPPMLLDHALRVSQFDSNTPIDDVLEDGQILDKLMLALEEAGKTIESISTSTERKGYILAKSVNKNSKQPEGSDTTTNETIRENLMYEDFHPFRPQQYAEDSDITILEFSGFNRTVDEFYSSIESQKLESRLTEREENAKRKLENAKQDHEKRLGGLQQVQELNVRKAQSIEGNLERVQEAIAAVNSLIAKGIDWVEIARLIEMEQERHNVVAEVIKLPLKLYENAITLLLAEATFDDHDDADFTGDETDSEVSDSDEDTANKSKNKSVVKPEDKRLAVDVDLALSPWSNARQYYDQKKSAAVKEQRTLQSSEKALKSTERKINADLKKGLKQEKELMRPQRKAYWFEKFVYFISSEGYLVIGGKDAQQNEILYKRHLRKGDVHVHADLQGATSIIIKNKPGKSEDPIPPGALSQAGTLAVATSSAWDTKAVMPAWWVYAEQVSKTSSTGEYLQPGVFTIKGEKNFLPPAQLLLGFAVVFRVSEESKERHLKHRIRDEAPSRSTLKAANAEEEAQRDDQASEEQSNVDDEANDIVSENESPDNVEIEKSDIDADSDGPKNPKDGFSGMPEAKRTEDNPQDSEDESESETEPENPLQPNGILDIAPGTHSVKEIDDSDELLGKDGNEAGETQISTTEEVDHEPHRDDKQATRHLSAQERRLLRKGAPSPSSNPTQSASSGADSQNITRSSTPAPSDKPITVKVRGKHGKRNKLKTKYADQDDEDRALAMRLLGSAAAQEKATQEAATKASKEEESAAQKERRRRQHILAAEKGKEAEEKRRRLFENDGGEEDNDEEETEAVGDLDAFVGAPLPGDEILDALVMCGPWDAIGVRCRWRVKLQPGTTKKGKAVREILGRWNASIGEWERKKRPGAGEGNEVMAEEARLRRREADLVRGFREAEVVGVVPVGKVRAVIGGGGGGGEGGGKGRSGGGKGKRGGKGSKRQR